MSSTSSDWRNVRIKDEPVSDVEGGRASSRYHGERDRRDGGNRREKRERYSPSPPPSHGKHKSAGQTRSRSRSNERDRDRNRRRERSSEMGRGFRNDRDGGGHPSRERESDRRPDPRRIKREPRSRSRSRSPPPPPQDRRRGGEFREPEARRDRDRSQGNRDDRGRPRDGVRERDWDNFFNPKSEMSKQAVVKREKDDQQRKDVMGEFGKAEEENPESEQKEKEQPNFGLSGKLTEEANTFRGVVIKYSEPPEARKPNKILWRLYPFKGEEALPVMYVHRQSAYLLGRDRKIADIPVDHPSCSKQHAALQYRLVPYERPDGSKGRGIRPYIIDLESANGTYVNGNRIDPKRYVQLFEKDVLKFGFSSREYVLLHDQSKDIVDDSPGASPD